MLRVKLEIVMPAFGFCTPPIVILRFCTGMIKEAAVLFRFHIL